MAKWIQKNITTKITGPSRQLLILKYAQQAETSDQDRRLSTISDCQTHPIR